MNAVEQYRRAVADAVETRARATKLGKAAKHTTDENLRQRALTAWRAAEKAEKAEKAVRETPLEVIAAAVAPSKSKAPILSEAIPGLSHIGPSGHLTTSQMCMVVQLIDQGHTVAELCEATGRCRNTFDKALQSWRAGTSRVAKRAKLRGMWPSGRAA